MWNDLVNAGIEIFKGVGASIIVALAAMAFRYFASKARTERGRWFAMVGLQIANRLEGLDLTNDEKKKKGINDLANTINKNYPFLKISDERLEDILEEAVCIIHNKYPYSDKSSNENQQ